MNLPLGVRDGSPSLGREEDITIVHFVETSPSVLREMPWITLKENPVTILLCLLSFLHFLVTSLLFIPSNQTLLPIFVSQVICTSFNHYIFLTNFCLCPQESGSKE